MDKNTIWAIVLSTLVIIGSYFLLPKFFGKKTETTTQASVEITADNTANNAQSNQTEVLTDTLFDEETSALLAEAEETEEEFKPSPRPEEQPAEPAEIEPANVPKSDTTTA